MRGCGFNLDLLSLAIFISVEIKESTSLVKIKASRSASVSSCLDNEFSMGITRKFKIPNIKIIKGIEEGLYISFKKRLFSIFVNKNNLLIIKHPKNKSIEL
jgi:hypothetical protein